MQSLELRIPPPAVAAVTAAAMWGIAKLLPVVASPPASVRDLIAIVIAFAGVLIALAGVISFRLARTTVNPKRPEKTSALVTSGIYRFTRNPMYLGMLLVLLGWAIHLTSVWALIGPVSAFYFYMTRFQIQPEERVLSEHFGDEFLEYQSRVRRWL